MHLPHLSSLLTSILQDVTDPILKSDPAFQLYLMKDGPEPSINSAVRRRDALLALTAVSTSAPYSDTSSTSPIDPASAAEAASSGLSSPSSPPLQDAFRETTLTSSQRVAQASSLV